MGSASIVESKAGSWIGSADSKATAVLTISAVVLALVSSTSAKGPQVCPFDMVIHYVYVSTSFFSILACLVSLYPRTNRLRILGYSAEQYTRKSLSYYGDISDMTYAKFSQKLADLKEDELQLDGIEQAYILARIAAIKMFWMRISIVLLAVSLGSLAIVAATR